MSILFFSFLAILIVSFIIALLNMVKTYKTRDMDKGFSNHLYCMIGMFIGGLGSLLTGITWLVQYFKS